MKISAISLFTFALAITWDPAAHAYLDGASGSMIIQVLLGGLAGIAVFLKLYWQALLVKLGIRTPEEDDIPENAAAETEQTES